MRRSNGAWIVLLMLVAAAIPILAGYVLFDQSRMPMLGVYLDGADPPVVTSVMIGSSAADAGLQPGDVLVAVDGAPYVGWSPAQRQLWHRYSFTLLRQGRRVTVPLTMESMLAGNAAEATSAAVVAFTFWGAALLLLRRRFRQADVRLLFLFYQACAIALLIGLAYPRFRLPSPWMVSLAVASLVIAAPLLLHYQATVPFVLGTPRQRATAFVALYGLTIAGAIDAALRPQPWTAPGVFGALLVATSAVGVALFVYFRRAPPGSRRRLRAAFAGTIVGLLLPMMLYILPMAVMGYSPAVPRWAVSLFLALIPLSYLYATARYDLFGIDHLINRATVYAVLSAGIFAVYLLALLLLYRFIPNRWLLHVIVASGVALITALTFQPVRGRVQRLVDRLFYSGWYDYPLVVEGASAKLARSRDWDDLAGILTRDVPLQMHLRGARLAVGERSASTLEPGVKSGLDVPLDCGGQARGAWTVGPRRDGGRFNPEDRRIVQTLAREAEISLSNVQLLETLRGQLDVIRASRESLVQLQHQLMRSREAERGRLARDLHDGPIQDLVGMNMQLGMLLPSGGDGAVGEAIAESLQDLRRGVRGVLGELRQVCTNLRPPMLDTLGLGAALRVLGEDWTAQHGVAVQLDLPPDAVLRALPEEVAVNLYRVAQETLSNVARHAKARGVSLCLSWDRASGRLELAVHDDGCGFVPAPVEDLAGQGHFGLAGIQERAALIGGEWRLDSAPGRGTTVRVTWQDSLNDKPH